MSRRKGERSGRIVLHVALTAGALLMIVPFVWMILSSLKSHAEITAFPPTWLPEAARFANYPEALQFAPFGTLLHQLAGDLGRTHRDQPGGRGDGRVRAGPAAVPGPNGRSSWPSWPR